MASGIAPIGTAMLLASVTADAASLYVPPQGDHAWPGVSTWQEAGSIVLR